jgi:hypothetical protein
VAYSAASPALEARSAAAENIQPMVLVGRWATIKAPTTMKAAKPSDRPAKLTGSNVLLATARMAAKMRLTT